MPSAALPVLRTPRLVLRPLEESDADAMVAGVGNYDVSRWLSVVPYPYGEDDALRFIGTVRGGDKRVWGIVDDSGLIGTVSVDDELGYWLARPAWRKGYGFEAARAVADHWFADPGADDLHSTYFDGNDRSGAVLLALGFRSSGKGRRFARTLAQAVDATDMVLTREVWEARTAFELYTPRLAIRPLTARDAKPLLRLSHRSVARNMASISPDWDEDAAAEWIEARAWRGWPGFAVGIVFRGTVIGVLGFGGAPLSVAFALEPNTWSKGFATEALSAFLPALFERFPVNRITAEHFEDNPASGAVLRKLGFDVTGEGVGASQGRLEPATVITYAVTRETLKVPV